MTAETILLADAMLTPDGVVVGAELAFDAGGWITYAGSTRESSERPAEAVTHRLDGQVLMPGFTNGHTHSAMTLQRGVSDDEGFMPWLETVQNIEQRLTHDDIVVGLELAMLEMIETGTVSFADMYYWDEALIECVRSAGMRVFAGLACSNAEHVAYPGVSVNGAPPLTGAEVLDDTERLADKYRDDPQVRVGFAPHAPYTCTAEFLRHVRERSIAAGVPIHTHLSESPAEIEQLLERTGLTPGDYLDSLDFFDAHVHVAHCVHLTQGEIETCARTGTSISHNPVSNLKLGNGIAPFPEMVEAGVRVALGTDSVASNNSLDMFEELKLATILHRGARENPSAVIADTALAAATAGGAEAIGFPESGALAIGRYADVISVDLTGTAAAPLSPQDMVSHIVYSATGRDVRNVFVGGTHLYADGQHLTLDADAIRARAREARARLTA